MSHSRLVIRNVRSAHGRTSMRLELELWDALEEICRREHTTLAGLFGRLAAPAGGRTSTVRVGILLYYRAAATEAGHLAAGHGGRQGRAAPPVRPGLSQRPSAVTDTYSGCPGQPSAA